jgi:predicted lipid-binding transport protein (Tim44 family)
MLRVRRAPAAWLLPVVLLAAGADAQAASLASLAPSLALMAVLAVWSALQSDPAGWATGSVAAIVGLAVLLAWQRGRQVRPTRRVAQPTVSADGATAAAGPCGLDCAELLGTAKRQFLRLQEAWDRCDMETLRALTTTDMLADICSQLPERGAGPNHTVVLALDAELLALEQVGGAELASIQFSGLIRERDDQGAVPFREVWMLARAPHDGPRWRLARQQALL